MSTTRRQWLAWCGAAAGSALATSCGGASTSAREAAGLASSQDVRAWLGEAVAAAMARWEHVEALAIRHEHTAVAVDVEGTSARSSRHGGALLSARGPGGLRYEASTAQLDRESLLELARHLGEVADAQRRPVRKADHRALPRPTALAPASAATAAPRRDRRGAMPSAATLQEEAAELAARADRQGGSRIVYRGAGLDLDATTVWYVGRSRSLEQRLLRRRAAVAVVASLGGRPSGAEASGGRGAAALVGATGDGEADAALWPRLAGAGPSEAELAEQLERVLRLTTPSAFPAGPAEVLLDPSLVGGLFEAILDAAARPEHAAAAARWRERERPAAAGKWQLIAAPSSPGAYGGYLFDDTGQAAAPAALLADGQLGPAALRSPHTVEDPVAGLRLRRGHLGDFAQLAPHLRLVAEGAGAEVAHAELRSRVQAGYALEGVTLARADLAADRLTLHARLARELRRGTYSGRAFADVELTASLAGFLDSITAWSVERGALCRRQLDDGHLRFFSAELPSLLGRADLRPRGAA